MAAIAESVNGDRHCAYCLKFLPSGTAKRCGKCNRRAYCSRECQTSDWKAALGSQGHKNWCGLECGEEDIDWEVKPIPGKGLGIIAKRPLPERYRIMVDPARKDDHPAIMDLMPENRSRREKINLNKTEYYTNFGGSMALCLRISRVNHSCDPYAHVYHDVKMGVTILYAERKIQAGEEITINYLQMNDVEKLLPPDHIQRPSEMRRYALKEKWTIVCPSDCRCRDKRLIQLIKECADFYEDMSRQYRLNNGTAAYSAIKKVLGILDEIRATSFTKMGALHDCFSMAISRRSTSGEATQYVQQAFQIVSSFQHPDSEDVKTYLNWVNNPQSHHMYLSLEKRKM